MKNRIFGIDYSMRSSYLGRWATVLVFSAVILLAVGALFLEQDDVAHTVVPIGVCAFDSVKTHSVLSSLADFVREQGGGDIKWIYFREGDYATGCDLYLMTSLQAAPRIVDGGLTCLLLATVKEGRRYSQGVVIVKAGAERVSSGDGKVIFTSPVSAGGFLSPLLALEACGEDLRVRPDQFDFAGFFPDEDRVIYGVLYGAYRAGGIALERLDYLTDRGKIRKGEIEVFCEGVLFPEIILAADKSADQNKLASFRRRLLLISGNVPPPLHQDLLSIGISNFVEPCNKTLGLFREIESHLSSGLITQ